MNHRAPAPLLCRNAKTFRSCLTFFGNIKDGGTLDFKHAQFLDPSALVLLHHVARTAGGKTVRFTLPVKVGPRAYLEDALTQGGQIGLFQNPNKYPLRYVQSESALAVELGKWREMLQASQALDEERAREFSSTLSEVLINSFVHGQTKGACIVGGQTFPKKKHTVLAAVDQGKTIPATLEASGRYPGDRTDEQWILHALARGVTCKTRETNMGFGLTVLSEMIKRNGGSMLIASRRGIVTITSGGDPVAEPLGAKYESFPGTFLILDIPVVTKP